MVYYFLRLSFSLGILNWVPNSFVFKKDWRDGPTAIDSEAFTEIVKKFRIVFLVGSYKHKHLLALPCLGHLCEPFFAFRKKEGRK